MRGSVVYTPGYVFQAKRDVTTANLNAAAAGTCTIENNAVGETELDPEVLGPENDVQSAGSASFTWTLDGSRVYHMLHLTLSTNVTTFTISGLVNGMLGAVIISNSGGFNLALPSGAYLLNGGGGPYSITPGSLHLLEFWYGNPNGSSRLFITSNDLTT